MVVAVFAASSSKIDGCYFEAATQLGKLFAKAGITAVYGGGGIGLMGALADAMLEGNGKVVGVIPKFMVDEGWDHRDVTEMITTETMSERKNKIFGLADAIVALPGGIGTLEELAEAITLKQLSLWKGPIIWLNTNGYYDSLLGFFDTMVGEGFMRNEHREIWKTVKTPEEAMAYLMSNNDRETDWRKIAKI